MIHPQRIGENIPVPGSDYDVIVAGAGPAGIGAALASSMAGARTLILEERSFFGGEASLGLWMPVNRVTTDGKPRSAVHDLFVTTITAHGPLAAVEGKRTFIDGDGMDIHPDYLRLAVFEMFEKVGCAYRLYSPVTDVIMSDRVVTGVVSSRKGHRSEFSASVVVDATGDGDVATLAGAAVMEGRESDGVHMPASLGFALANVDVDKFLRFFTDSKEEFKAIVDQGEKAGYATAVWYSFDRTTVPGVVSVNNGAFRGMPSLDATNAADLTLAERLGAEVAVDFVRLARDRKIPGLEECALIRTGAAVGVRDTRRVVGEYVQTVEDAEKGARFSDVVARKYGAIDAVQLYQGTMTSGFDYPYRSLVPLEVDGLLMAGRCASATFMGHAAGKSMGNMMGLGVAAGAAASLAARTGVTPRDVDVSELQKLLTGMGVDLAATGRNI
ncbi:MAG: FAD-dependent oxidoreductase [Spirochaetales bacterium]|nr:MAG: FAD-dependent oxidoreductase [Spirochaetales bacterium]